MISRSSLVLAICSCNPLHFAIHPESKKIFARLLREVHIDQSNFTTNFFSLVFLDPYIRLGFHKSAFDFKVFNVLLSYQGYRKDFQMREKQREPFVT